MSVRNGHSAIGDWFSCLKSPAALSFTIGLLHLDSECKERSLCDKRLVQLFKESSAAYLLYVGKG